MQAIIVDVSNLPPPEPMKNVLAALGNLKAGDYIQMVHRREPFPLYNRLLDAGYSYFCHAIGDDLAPKFHIYIARKAEFATMMAQLKLDINSD